MKSFPKATLIKWSLKLINKSLELSPDDRLAIKVKVEVLRALEEFDNAVSFIKKRIKHEPKILTYRNLLIDTYFSMDCLMDAEGELKLGLQQFGNKLSLLRRKELLKKSLQLC